MMRRPRGELKNAPVSLALLLILMLGNIAGQQGPQAPTSDRRGTAKQGSTFRAEIEYVEVDAIVTDEHDKPVAGLTVNDFEVLEDGKPQGIGVFLPVHLQSARARSRVVRPTLPEPDVRSSRASQGGRLYVIVLDDLNTHPARTNRVTAAAKQFIESHLADNDLAALVFTSGTAESSRELTNSRQQLLTAVQKFVGKKLLSSTLERLQTYQSESNRAAFMDSNVGNVPDQLDPARAFRARQTFRALQDVGEYLMGVRGLRKSIIYLGEGVDYDLYNLTGENLSDAPAGPRSNASEVFSSVREALATLARARVAVYAVDPRLNQPGEEFIDVKGIATEAHLNIGMSSLQSELKLSQDTLRTLAAETGGFAELNGNNYREAFDRITQENSVYYLLGYYPTSTPRPGRFYRTEVKVKRPGLKVRARRGYMIPKARSAPDKRLSADTAGISRDLREALSSPVPLDGLGLSATAATFRGSGIPSSIAVILQVHLQNVAFGERDGRFSNALEISYLAIDSQGHTRAAQRDSITLSLRPQTHEQALRDGIRLISRMALAPGRYQLRIGVREVNGGVIGTVACDLDVPDFTKSPLAMSNLLIASQRTTQIPTPQPDPMFEQKLKIQPTTVRAFATDDILVVAADLYAHGPTSRHLIDVVTTIDAEDGVAVFRQERSYEPQDRVNTHTHLELIPLKHLASGDYVIRVAAKGRVGVDAPVERALLITIR